MSADELEPAQARALELATTVDTAPEDSASPAHPPSPQCPPALLESMPRRLGKALHEGTGRSRRALTRALHECLIEMKCPGQPRHKATTLATLIFEGDELWLNDEPISWAAPRQDQSFIFHKPKGVITTMSDPQGRPDLSSWLAPLSDAIFPVGRLDRETTGMLLLTNDGDLAYMLLQPDHHIPKSYHLRLLGEPAQIEAALAQLRDGVTLDDGPACALSAQIIAGGDGWCAVVLVIDEGRNRQVRRMCRAVGLRLDHLHRLAIGSLRLGPLGAGQLRPLSPTEQDALWDEVGGRHIPALKAVMALDRLAQHARDAQAPDLRLEAWLSRDDLIGWMNQHGRNVLRWLL